jgi:hypothetical protein
MDNFVLTQTQMNLLAEIIAQAPYSVAAKAIAVLQQAKQQQAAGTTNQSNEQQQQ